MSKPRRASVPLAPLTTFELGGPARAFVDIDSEAELLDVLRDRARGSAEGGTRLVDHEPLFVLGGGSNVVVSDRGFDGLVLHVASRGVEQRDEGERTLVTAAAGEPWDAFVERMVREDLAGVEALSGIPGLVGATPIQNVGAYGQDVSETIVAVRTVDARTGEVRTRSNAECRFTYRHSLFKEEAAHEIVTSVTFALRRGGAPAIRYPELQKALAAHGSASPSLREVRDVVVSLRRSKSMVVDANDPNRRSAGSFFVNPIVPAAQADDVAARAIALGVIAEPREMPRFPAENGAAKLSAGWLIERSGMTKGTRRGNVGLSSRHALALVHHGGGTADELLAFAAEVQASVERAFGVLLRPEPVLVGFSSTATST